MPSLDLENPKPSFFQRKQIAVMGVVPVGKYMKPGWKEPILHYMFLCPRHGYVVDYPHGYSQRLTCPKCREEKNK